jgi:hypothetical protein
MSIYNLEHNNNEDLVNGIKISSTDTTLYNPLTLIYSQQWILEDQQISDEDDNAIGTCSLQLTKLGGLITCVMYNFSFSTVNATTNTISTPSIIPTTFKSETGTAQCLGTIWIQQGDDGSVSYEAVAVLKNSDDYAALEISLISNDTYDTLTSFVLGGDVTELTFNWLGFDI